MRPVIEFLGDRFVPERARRRRRLEIIARHWALHLWARHGYHGALIRCSRRIAACDLAGAGVRRQLWRRVWARLLAVRDK